MSQLRHLVHTLILLGCLALPSAAAAAPGDLTYAGCFGDIGVQSCVDLPEFPLTGVADVAVSPDGRSVYAVSFQRDAVLHFFRGSDGALSYDGCVNNDGTQNCTGVTGAPLDGPVSVAVSPDNRSVYVATQSNNGLVELSRALPDGQLAFVACAAEKNPVDACGDIPEKTMTSPRSVAVSPDGRSVYVAAQLSDSVVHFTRGQPGGFAFKSCVSDNAPVDDCTDLPAALSAPPDVAVSPDGRSVYVTSIGSRGVFHLTRDAQGDLGFGGCLSTTDVLGCSRFPGRPQAFLTDLVATNDAVHVLANQGDVLELSRDPGSGRLAYSGCITHAADAPPCADVLGREFEMPLGLATAADGRSVYVATNRAIGRLGTDPLGFGSCVTSGASEACAQVPDTPTGSAVAVAASLDGRSVYAVAATRAALVRFDVEQRVVQPTPDQAPQPTSEPQPQGGTPTCGGKPATLVGTPGADRLRGTRRVDVIVALAGNDIVTGLRGNDIACGGSGNDRLSGGAGRDRLNGGRGRDRCLGGNGRDRATSCETKRSL